MSRRLHTYQLNLTLSIVVGLLMMSLLAAAQGLAFRNAPASASQMKNPYSGDAQAAAGGRKLYSQNCAQCHGNNLQGIGPAPGLISPTVKNASGGELFWFVTNGDLNKGMPSWSNLPKQQRWQIVTYVKSKNEGQ